MERPKFSQAVENQCTDPNRWICIKMKLTGTALVSPCGTSMNNLLVSQGTMTTCTVEGESHYVLSMSPHQPRIIAESQGFRDR